MPRVACAAALVLLRVLVLPTTAHAQGYFAPFAGADFGGDAASCTVTTIVDCTPQRITYGFSAGKLSHGTIGAEVDFAYAPRFFGGPPYVNVPDAPHVSNNSVLSLMGNIVVALPARSMRPYVAGGLGMLRAKVDQLGELTNFSDASFGYNLGGGLMVFLARDVGFRVDYRYVSTFQDISVSGQTLLTTGTKLNFSRLVFALVVH